MQEKLSYKVITAVGPDRVGIADDLAEIASRTRCNIEESKMAVLGGEFAVIMLVSGKPENLHSLSEEMNQRGEKLGLQIFVKNTQEPVVPPRGIPYTLQTISQDTPGIVHAVTSILRRYSINIEDLETETSFAPWSGAPLFHMRARILVPQGVPIHELREELLSLEMQQDLHIELKPFFPAPRE
ncbi:MAG: amino acid-binding protein [Spirochaetes bacterium]|nr:amino acid-binding protein [Spirochaetota bacterium]